MNMPFIDYEAPEKICRHPEHEPPTHIVLRPGKHVYQCPSCKEQQILNVPEITL